MWRVAVFVWAFGSGAATLILCTEPVWGYVVAVCLRACLELAYLIGRGLAVVRLWRAYQWWGNVVHDWIVEAVYQKACLRYGHGQAVLDILDRRTLVCERCRRRVQGVRV